MMIRPRYTLAELAERDDTVGRVCKKYRDGWGPVELGVSELRRCQVCLTPVWYSIVQVPPPAAVTMVEVVICEACAAAYEKQHNALTRLAE